MKIRDKLKSALAVILLALLVFQANLCFGVETHREAVENFAKRLFPPQSQLLFWSPHYQPEIGGQEEKKEVITIPISVRSKKIVIAFKNDMSANFLYKVLSETDALNADTFNDRISHFLKNPQLISLTITIDQQHVTIGQDHPILHKQDKQEITYVEKKKTRKRSRTVQIAGAEKPPDGNGTGGADQQEVVNTTVTNEQPYEQTGDNTKTAVITPVVAEPPTDDSTAVLNGNLTDNDTGKADQQIGHAVGDDSTETNKQINDHPETANETQVAESPPDGNGTGGADHADSGEHVVAEPPTDNSPAVLNGDLTDNNTGVNEVAGEANQQENVVTDVQYDKQTGDNTETAVITPAVTELPTHNGPYPTGKDTGIVPAVDDTSTDTTNVTDHADRMQADQPPIYKLHITYTDWKSNITKTETKNYNSPHDARMAANNLYLTHQSTSLGDSNSFKTQTLFQNGSREENITIQHDIPLQWRIIGTTSKQIAWRAVGVTVLVLGITASAVGIYSLVHHHNHNK